ncbi:uncharacterized protein PAC_05602 [Phialocephala subalpina]|uniref:Uncharacterized protein n=1 Tax=Phialocephala subalpina TaxID=576137 RepID=A0A1L7WSG6_9HELO|nr:uncharacterized protein PAC_05602 [Phialocephala subalpina]
MTLSTKCKIDLGERMIGTARVAISSLEFVGGRELDSRIVDGLIKNFELRKCRRYDPDHYIPVIISTTQLKRALRASNINQSELLSPTKRGSLCFLKTAVGQKLQCLQGKHRVKAAEEFFVDSRDRWWAIRLFLCDSTDVRDKFFALWRHDYTFQVPPNDGDVYLNIRECHRSGKHLDVPTWESYLTPCKKTALSRLLGHKDFTYHFDELRVFPGLWVWLELGNIQRHLALRCDEVLRDIALQPRAGCLLSAQEIIRYLKHIKEIWDIITCGIMIIQALVDMQTVEAVQCRAPGVSSEDRDFIIQAMGTGLLFPKVTDQSMRQILLESLLSIECLIPSIKSLHENLKYVDIGAKILKHLVLPSKVRYTLQEDLRKCWKSPEYIVESGKGKVLRDLSSNSQRLPWDLAYKQLWLIALRAFPDLGGRAPRKEIGGCLYATRLDPLQNYLFAESARRIGFNSEEIEKTLTNDPRKESLRTAVGQVFNLESADLEGLIDKMFLEFPTTTKSLQLEPLVQDCQAIRSDLHDLNRRWGVPYQRAFEDGRENLYIPNMTENGLNGSHDMPSAMFIQRDFMNAFFGKTMDLPEDLHESLAIPSPTMERQNIHPQDSFYDEDLSLNDGGFEPVAEVPVEKDQNMTDFVQESTQAVNLPPALSQSQETPHSPPRLAQPQRITQISRENSGADSSLEAQRSTLIVMPDSGLQALQTAPQAQPRRTDSSDASQLVFSSQTTNVSPHDSVSISPRIRTNEPAAFSAFSKDRMITSEDTGKLGKLTAIDGDAYNSPERSPRSIISLLLPRRVSYNKRWQPYETARQQQQQQTRRSRLRLSGIPRIQPDLGGILETETELAPSTSTQYRITIPGSSEADNEVLDEQNSTNATNQEEGDIVALPSERQVTPVSMDGSQSQQFGRQISIEPSQTSLSRPPSQDQTPNNAKGGKRDPGQVQSRIDRKLFATMPSRYQRPTVEDMDNEGPLQTLSIDSTRRDPKSLSPVADLALPRSGQAVFPEPLNNSIADDFRRSLESPSSVSSDRFDVIKEAPQLTSVRSLIIQLPPDEPRSGVASLLSSKSINPIENFTESSAQTIPELPPDGIAIPEAVYPYISEDTRPLSTWSQLPPSEPRSGVASLLSSKSINPVENFTQSNAQEIPELPLDRTAIPGAVYPYITEDTRPLSTWSRLPPSEPRSGVASLISTDDQIGKAFSQSEERSLTRLSPIRTRSAIVSPSATANWNDAPRGISTQPNTPIDEANTQSAFEPFEVKSDPVLWHLNDFGTVSADVLQTPAGQKPSPTPSIAAKGDLAPRVSPGPPLVQEDASEVPVKLTFFEWNGMRPPKRVEMSSKAMETHLENRRSWTMSVESKGIFQTITKSNIIRHMLSEPLETYVFVQRERFDRWTSVGMNLLDEWRQAHPDLVTTSLGLTARDFPELSFGTFDSSWSIPRCEEHTMTIQRGTEQMCILVFQSPSNRSWHRLNTDKLPMGSSVSERFAHKLSDLQRLRTIDFDHIGKGSLSFLTWLIEKPMLAEFENVWKPLEATTQPKGRPSPEPAFSGGSNGDEDLFDTESSRDENSEVDEGEIIVKARLSDGLHDHESTFQTTAQNSNVSATIQAVTGIREAKGAQGNEHEEGNIPENQMGLKNGPVILKRKGSFEAKGREEGAKRIREFGEFEAVHGVKRKRSYDGKEPEGLPTKILATEEQRTRAKEGDEMQAKRRDGIPAKIFQSMEPLTEPSQNNTRTRAEELTFNGVTNIKTDFAANSGLPKFEGIVKRDGVVASEELEEEL